MRLSRRGAGDDDDRRVVRGHEWRSSRAGTRAAISLATVSAERFLVVAVVRADAQRPLRRAVQEEPIDIVEVPSGLALIREVLSRRPCAVVLDLDCSDVDGLELLQTLRAASDVPVLALTEARPDPDVSVHAFELGADDVAFHSTHAVELRARLNALLRRRGRTQRPSTLERTTVRTGALEIDRRAREVRKHGQPIRLTRAEYRVLDALAARPGELVPHPMLLHTVRGEGSVEDTHYLRIYVGYLRSKLEDDPSQPRYLVSEWGVGYRLALLPLETDGEAASD